MRPGRFVLIALAVFAMIAGPLAAQTSGPDAYIGTWLGELQAGAVTLRLVFNITAGSPGALGATMDSPDQGAKGIPVSKVDVSGGKILLEVKVAAGSYSGTMAADGKSITGAWSQGGRDFPVTLKKQDSAFALERPQEPKPPFPYSSIDVTFTNKKAGIELAGTLCVPPGKGPFPAVVLVTGSGPQNRDEDLMGHKPFLVISDFLARAGISVLRYDDRGLGKSNGDSTKATSFDFADDAEAAFTFLLARPEVDPKRVGIAGHSEGGLFAPIVASRDPAVGFIILLAGPGIRGDKLLLLQDEALMRASGADEKAIARAGALNKALYDIAERESDPARIVSEGRREAVNAIDADASLSDQEKAQAKKDIDQGIAPLAQPWFRAFQATLISLQWRLTPRAGRI